VHAAARNVPTLQITLLLARLNPVVNNVDGTVMRKVNGS
jgi:hypothetical protein